MKKLTKQAFELATKAHKGQTRASGGPYLNHPKQVASLLGKWNQDDEVIAAGFLHDVVEDTNISLKEIEKKFGKRVAFLVDGMSWIRDKKTRIKDWDASYQKFSDHAIKDPCLVLIKLADMISNIPNIHAKTEEEFITKRSYPKAKSFWLPFLKQTGFKKEARHIQKEYEKQIKKRIKIILYDYISRKELKQIKLKLRKDGRT